MDEHPVLASNTDDKLLYI